MIDFLFIPFLIGLLFMISFLKTINSMIRKEKQEQMDGLVYLTSILFALLISVFIYFNVIR